MVDYHDFTTRNTPVRQRRQWGIGNLWINAARCRTCGEVVRSRNRHDFRWCGCGAIAVDGGSWYIKRSTAGEGGYDELSELFADVEQQG